MELVESFITQYNKTLNILTKAIENYREDLWYDRENYPWPAWQVAYHALFYTNIYAAATAEKIIPWSGQKERYEILGKPNHPPFEPVNLDRTFSRSEMGDFCRHVYQRIPEYLKEMNPHEPCWPNWYDEDQLEFHMNNLRHTQHHIGEIIERHNNVIKLPYLWQ